MQMDDAMWAALLRTDDVRHALAGKPGASDMLKAKMSADLWETLWVAYRMANHGYLMESRACLRRLLCGRALVAAAAVASPARGAPIRPAGVRKAAGLGAGLNV